MPNYSLKVIDSLSLFRSYRQQWDALLKSSKVNNIFLTWDWQFSWAECFLADNRTLIILMIYKGNKLVGIAPLYIARIRQYWRTVRQIYFLGFPEAGSDYLDVIIKKGEEKKVASLIYDYFMSEWHEWDCFNLNYIPSDSLFLLYFHERLLDDGKCCDMVVSAYCPVVNLPETEEDFLFQLSSNRRQQYRRHVRLLNKEIESQYTVESAPTPEMINIFFNFYDEKTNYSSKNTKIMIERFLLNTEKPEIIQIDKLSSGDHEIAELLHFNYGEIISMYLMAIDKEYMPKISIGNILVGKSIEEAVRNNKKVYDFLKGEEYYKFHWATTGNRSLKVVYYNKSISGVLLAIFIFFKKILKVFVR